MSFSAVKTGDLVKLREMNWTHLEGIVVFEDSNDVQVIWRHRPHSITWRSWVSRTRLEPKDVQ